MQIVTDLLLYSLCPQKIDHFLKIESLSLILFPLFLLSLILYSLFLPISLTLPTFSPHLSYFTNSTLKPVPNNNRSIVCGRREYDIGRLLPISLLLPYNITSSFSIDLSLSHTHPIVGPKLRIEGKIKSIR